MRIIKTLSLAMLGMAFAGANVASADNLCKASACPPGIVYGIGAEIVAESWNMEIVGGVGFKVSCSKSVFEGRVAATGGAEVEVEVTSFWAEQCGGSCIGAFWTFEETPYNMRFNATGGGNGTARTPLRWVMKNCLGLNLPCTYKTSEAVASVLGGELAVIKAEGVSVTRTAGPCPATGTLTGSWTVANPGPVWVT